MSTSENELLEMENASQIGLKALKRCITTTVIGIISLKTKNIWLFYNRGQRTWQPFLVGSQPILDFLEPCFALSEMKSFFN